LMGDLATQALALRVHPAIDLPSPQVPWPGSRSLPRWPAGRVCCLHLGQGDAGSLRRA
jgi:hypothetical protein